MFLAIVSHYMLYMYHLIVLYVVVANQIGGRRRGARTIEEVDKPVETSPPAVNISVNCNYNQI